jgi:hypothetical protein
MRTPFYTLIICAFALILYSCKGDSNTIPKVETSISEVDLHGKWEIAKAYRDGQITRLLDNGKVTMSEDGTFTTNIFGDPKAYPFELRNNTVRVATPRPTKYLVSEVTSDTLKLSTKFRNFEFRLIMTPAE